MVEDYQDAWPNPYAELEDIEFARDHLNLRELVFMDDMFLSMQAMNIAASDQVVTRHEYELLHAYRPDERVPFDIAVEVSALAQMWIFALYELLRLWRQRWSHLATQQKNGMLEQVAKDTMARANEQKNTALLIRASQAQSVLEDPAMLAHAARQFESIKPLWVPVETVRMNLAKHGAPGGKGTIVPAMPGHGRINQYCGALDWEVVNAEGKYARFSRRDLAEVLRALEVERYQKST